MSARKKLNVGAIIVVSLLCIATLAICYTVLKVNESKNSAPKETKNVSEVVDDVSEVIDDVIIGSEGTISTVVAAPTLDDLISISNLQSLTYNYNSICTVYDDDGEIAYYVSYRGTVVLGIDMESVHWDCDDIDKTVTFYLPNIECQGCTVDATSLRYIFVDESYDNGNTGAQALSACQEDLQAKTSDPVLCSTMYSLAEENCKTGIIGMFQPLIDQFFPEYTMDVVFESEVGGA